MNYLNLVGKQIYLEEVDYSLDDFIVDFRARLKNEWGAAELDKDNGKKTLYQGLLMIVVFASQGKSKELIGEIVFGGKDEKRLHLLSQMLELYSKEIELIEASQMRMFLENLRKYYLSDSLNLNMLNADFRIWFKKALESKA